VVLATEGATVKRQDVTSREYKVMLLPARFPGTDGQVLPVVERFWADVGVLLAPVEVDTQGSFDRVKAHRRIRFFDTSDNGLNRQRYMFRERVDVDSGEREVTLKYRHPDRYVAQDRDMDSSIDKDTKTKFEEDIKPPFQHLFSFSTSQLIAQDRKVARIKDVLQLFPGLKGSLKGFTDEESLAVVDDFTARELVIGGAAVQLGKKHNVSSGCVLVIWYDNAEANGSSVVAEFSFKYGDNGEAYGGGTVRRAYDMFQMLQARLGDWTDADSKTKTAFVYS
jgi:hypothetical protein